MSTQGQGPLNDPRLVERRGDLSGLNALMFLALVIVAFVAAAFLLYTLIRGAPAVSPSPSPTAVPSLSASPSATAKASSSPSPSVAPSAAASPITTTIGSPADVFADGVRVGTVTVESARFNRTLEGKQAPKGMRWLLISVTLKATADLAYDENNWSAVDASGERHGWRGSDPPPSLGEGTLAAGKSRTGNVTFAVPVKPATTSVVLTSPDGDDLVIVTIPETRSPGE